MEAGHNHRWKAILLLGPTGSGKTPLGQLLALRGLNGKRCVHFDFGNILRTCINNPNNQLAQDDISVIRKVLMTGALLEDKHFLTAKKLLLNYLKEQQAGEDTLIILNGLPRHVGQAAAMEKLIDMQLLVKLECPFEVVLDRIQIDIGGDRSGRIDDTPNEVKQRVELFKQRTEPLVDYYRVLMVPLICVDVKAGTTAQEMHQQIEARYPF